MYARTCQPTRVLHHLSGIMNETFYSGNGERRPVWQQPGLQVKSSDEKMTFHMIRSGLKLSRNELQQPTSKHRRRLSLVWSFVSHKCVFFLPYGATSLTADAVLCGIW